MASRARPRSTSSSCIEDLVVKKKLVLGMQQAVAAVVFGVNLGSTFWA